MTTKVKDYDIPSGNRLPLDIKATHFMIFESATAVNVRFKRKGTVFASAFNVERGFAIGPVAKGFDGIDIETVSGAIASVKLAFSDDPIDYRRITGTVDATDVTPSQAVPLADVALVAATAIKVADANADRAFLSLYNAGPGDLRWGTVTNKPGVAAGARIPAGIGIDVRCSAEIWVYPIANSTAELTDVRK